MAFKMICFDVDGVFVKPVNFWMELHKVYDTYEEGAKITKKYLNDSESDYEILIEKVVNGLWKGKSQKLHDELGSSMEYLSGINELFDYVYKKGFKTAIISGSGLPLIERLQKDFDIDWVCANELVFKDGKATGKFIAPIANFPENKTSVLLSLCEVFGVEPEEIIYISDGYMDVDIFKVVGLSIAFNSTNEELKKLATHVVDSDDLNDVIPFLP